MPIFNDPGVPQINWPTPSPVLGAMPKDNIGTLADAIKSIQEGQQQRKLDQMKLEEARLMLAEKQRAAAQDAAMRAEVAKIAGETMPQGTLIPDMGAGLNPMSPIPLMPDATRTTRPLTSEEARTRIQQALLKTGQGGKYLDTIRQIELPMERADAGLELQRQKMRQGLVTAFKNNPAGLKSLNRRVLEEAGFNYDSVQAMPSEAQGQKIEYFNDDVKGPRPYVMTKQGVPHFLDEYSANVNLAQVRAQAAGEQARVTQQTGAALRPVPYTDPTTNTTRLGTVSPRGIAPMPIVGTPVTAGGEGFTGPLPEPDLKAPVPAPFATPTDIPAVPFEPAPTELQGRLDAQPGAPIYAESPRKGGETGDLAERKFALAQAKEERLRFKQENEQWVREGKALDKSPAVVQYRAMAQPMSNIAVAEEMVSENGGNPAEMDIPGGDPAVLRQVDNLLVRTAASLFEPKVGVVREGEVANLVGGTNMKQAIFRFMQSANWDERNVVEVMPPAMRRAIISAARKTQELRAKDFEYIKGLASEKAQGALKFDVNLPSQGAPTSGKRRFKMNADGTLQEVK